MGPEHRTHWGRGCGQSEDGREAQGSDLPKPTVSLKSPRWRLLPWGLLISAGQALRAAYSQILALVELKIRVRATHNPLRDHKYSSGCCQVTSVVSNSVRLHRRQPTRLPRPWDSPGKNTGVSLHFLLQCMKVKSLSRVRLLATPWTAAYQAPPPMRFSRQE